MLKKFNTYFKEINDTYQLHKKESDIFSVLLCHQSGLISKEIQDKTSFLRLTVLYNLKKLENRNLISRDVSGKAHVWTCKFNESNDVSEGIVTTTPIEAYATLDKSESKHLIGIQGVHAVKALVKILASHEGVFHTMHKRQKQRNVIINSILFGSSVKDICSIPSERYRTHLGRPTNLRIIEKESEQLSNYEVISDGKLVVVIDREKEIAVIIKNRMIVEITVGLLEIIANYGKTQNIAEIYGAKTN